MPHTLENKLSRIDQAIYLINTLKAYICVSISVSMTVLLPDQWTELLQNCTDDRCCIRECTEKFW